MSDQHLSYFKVENFKCFENLEIEDIGQFNLIVGDNNVGKTSLLEALMIKLPFQTFVDNIYNCLLTNDVPLTPNPTLFQIFHRLCNSDKILTFIYKLKTKHKKFSFKLNKNDSRVFKNEIEDPNFKLIDYKPSKADVSNFVQLNQHNINTILIRLFTSLENEDYRNVKKIQEILDLIISDVERVSYSKIDDLETILLGVSHNKKPLPITSFGEGTRRLSRILLEVMNSNNEKILLIDEIDTGIHYSRMKDFLKKLILLAEKNDTQLFMTTHSEECQRFFLEIFEEDKELKELQKKVRHIEMYRNKNGLIKAATRNFGVALESLKMGIEIRR